MIEDELNQNEFWAEISRERAREAYRAIVAIRKARSDFRKKPIVTVLVPECEDCYGYQGHVHDWLDWRIPDIRKASWHRDLRDFGATREEIQRIERGQFGLFCRSETWPHEIDYRDQNVYVHERSFESYFGPAESCFGFEEFLDEGDLGLDSRRPKARRWMKKLVFEAYNGECFGCGKKLTFEEKSTDHIEPFKKGNTVLMNLQLLCRFCDETVKNNQEPEEEHFTLHFPLVPPPSDGHEGPVW
jgi:hypothetical protein